MTSRERVIKAINHEEPDRVPLDLGASYTSGISACALYRLREYYGLEKRPIGLTDPAQLLGQMDDDIVERMGIDVIALQNPFDCIGVTLRGEMQDFVMHDGTPIKIAADHKITQDEEGKVYLYPQGNDAYGPSWVCPKGGYFFDVMDKAPKFDEDNLTPAEDFKDDFWQMSDEDADWLAENAKLLNDTTDKAVLGALGAGSIGSPAFIPGGHVLQPKGIRSFQDWCMAQLLYPEYVEEVFEMQTQNCIKNLEIYHQAVGDNIQIVSISGTDFGTQNGPIMSLDTFEELYMPYYKRMNDWVHQNTNWKTYYHSCGAVYEFLDDFVEMGVDIINPVQLNAAGMDAHKLKENYGDKLVFWGGGIETQTVLPNATPEKVREEVRKNLDALAHGGGYVFNTIHNIMGDIPAENIAACYDAARNYQF